MFIKFVVQKCSNVSKLSGNITFRFSEKQSIHNKVEHFCPSSEMKWKVGPISVPISWNLKLESLIHSFVFFFFGYRENDQITPPAQGGAEGSVRLLLNKNPVSLLLPQLAGRGFSFERFPRRWRRNIHSMMYILLCTTGHWAGLYCELLWCFVSAYGNAALNWLTIIIEISTILSAKHKCHVTVLLFIYFTKRMFHVVVLIYRKVELATERVQQTATTDDWVNEFIKVS